MKKEEEIAEFYKSESENSEGEHSIDKTQNNAMSHQNNNQRNLLQNISRDLTFSCDNIEDDFSSKCNTSAVNIRRESEVDILISPSEDFHVSTDSNINELKTVNSNVSCNTQINSIPLSHEDQMNDGSIIDTIFENADSSVPVVDHGSIKLVNSDPLFNSDLDLARSKDDKAPEKNDEAAVESDEAHDEVDEVLTESDRGHEEVDEVLAENHEVFARVEKSLFKSDEELEAVNKTPAKDCVHEKVEILNPSTESYEENQISLSTNVEDYVPAQDTEDFVLEIENSPSIEVDAESSIAISSDSPARADSETIRRKKLALLSARNLKLSDPKLKRDENSMLQFEIDCLPEPEGVISFIKKFASHVIAKNKTHKQPTKMR